MQLKTENKLSNVQVLVFEFIGSKFRLAPYIINLFPEHKFYCEVFGGMAAVLLRKKPGVDVYNDISNDLCNLFMVLKDRFDEFINNLDGLPASRALLEYYNELNKDVLPKENIGKDVNRAVRWAYINLAHKVFIRSMVKHGKRYRVDYYALRDIHFRLKNVVIENLDFEECIKKYDVKDTVFYCDPPYYKLEYYEERFGDENHKRLYEVLKNVKGKWIVSYNAHKEIIEMYRKYFMIKIQYLTTFSGVGPRTYNELLIMNYKPQGVKEGDKIEIIANEEELNGQE